MAWLIQGSVVVVDQYTEFADKEIVGSLDIKVKGVPLFLLRDQSATAYLQRLSILGKNLHPCGEFFGRDTSLLRFDPERVAARSP